MKSRSATKGTGFRPNALRRLAGARSRAEARKSGRHRDLGIASKKQQQRHIEQAERQVVRQIIAEQLTESNDELAA